MSYELTRAIKMVDKEDMEALAYDHTRVDNLAQLLAWGAPWFRCWGEINTLEERWPIGEIEKMVNERAKHPDYCQNVSVKYPNKGWFGDLLKTTRPGFFEVQKLSLVLGDMTMYMSHDVKSLFNELTEEEEKERTLAIEILKESIDAIDNYCPDRLDEKGKELFSRSRAMLLSTLKMQLASIINKESPDEAEELFPGIGNPEMFLESDEVSDRIVDIVELAQESVEYMNEQSVFGLEESFEETLSNQEVEASIEEGGFSKADDDRNPKFHLYRAYENCLISGEKPDKVIEHTESAFALVDNFLNPESKDVDEEKLFEVAEEFNKIDYFDYHSMYMDELSRKLMEYKRFSLARKVLMLNYVIENLNDEGYPGYRKASEEMFYRNSLAMCLLEEGKFQEAKENILRAYELAEIYHKPTDVTQRVVAERFVTKYGVNLWLISHLNGDNEEAENRWEEVIKRESFKSDFDGFINDLYLSLEYKWLAIILTKFLINSGKERNLPEAARIKNLFIGKSEDEKLTDRMQNMITNSGGDKSKVGNKDENQDVLKKFLLFLEENKHSELHQLLTHCTNGET